MNNTHLSKNNLSQINFADERVDGADKVNGKAKYTAEYNYRIWRMAYS